LEKVYIFQALTETKYQEQNSDSCNQLLLFDL